MSGGRKAGQRGIDKICDVILGQFGLDRDDRGSRGQRYNPVNRGPQHQKELAVCFRGRVGFSGGNQQKVVLGRWLERSSNPLVLVEPTRGVDVGARQEIYASIRSLAREGKAILVVTSDYEETVQLADRALVMSRGRLVAGLSGEDVTTQALIDASGG